jgi:hypothetical protein
MDGRLILLKAGSFSMCTLVPRFFYAGNFSQTQRLGIINSFYGALYLAASTSLNLLPFRIFRFRDQKTVTESHNRPAEELSHLQNIVFG